MEGKKRPILIGIIGFFTILAAVLMLVVATVALFSDTLLADYGLSDIESLIGYGGFISGIILLIIGISIWRGWTIAWYIAVIIYAIGLIVLIYSIAQVLIDDTKEFMLTAPLAISLLIVLLILFYLFRPKVKEFFGV